MKRLVLTAVLVLAVRPDDRPAARTPSLAQEPKAMFRAGVELVTIDAFAHRDGQPLSGLTARDFLVRDNGVEQHVAAVHTTDSAHVVIGLDFSASVEGASLARLRSAAATLVERLTPQDRLSLFTFSDRIRVWERANVPGPASVRALKTAKATGSTTLHDAFVLGSALARTDSRPAVLLLFTDGHDTASWATAGRVLDVLRRSDVVVYTVGAGLPMVAASSQRTPYFRHDTWLAPSPGDALRLLQLAADITGGEFLRVGARDRLDDTFARILSQYRSRYLLSYSPQGVKRDDGWHQLQVHLRSGIGTVVAREGYLARGLE